MPNRRPTGSDVARVAGVSKSAVSRAFTGGVVSDEARARILEAARILKYRPNNAARSLSTNRSRLIGLAITSLDNQFYPMMVELLHERLAAIGYRLVLFITHGAVDLDPVLDELLGFRLDGVILASSSHAARVASECLEAGVPAVMLNNVDLDGHLPGVCTDNAAGARAIAAFLLAKGHRRFGMITGLAESSASEERAEAFAAALAQQPDARLLTECGEFVPERTYRAACQLLDRPQRPEALFCVTDFMAFSALQAAIDLGLTPGKDVDIFGFDDVPIANWPCFGLATYAQPLPALVDAAVDLLQAQMEGRPFERETQRLTGWLVPRASAGA